MPFLIVLSGPVGVGKSSFAEALLRVASLQKISTRPYIMEKTGAPSERKALQDAGNELDDRTGGEWVADAVATSTKGAAPDTIFLLDSARKKIQLEALRNRFGSGILHVHLTASSQTLKKRYQEREHDVEELKTYEDVQANPTEAAIGKLARIADIVLSTEDCTPDELAAVTLAAAGIRPFKKYPELVDVFVGGQYGSEGKGNICSFMANRYAVLMRIGGPNAGHWAAYPKYKYVQLPSGTGANPNAQILIGAGSTLWLPQLMREIADHKLVNSGRLKVDPQAMVIDDEDRRIEGDTLEAIASTKQGVGVATARKILGRGGLPPLGSRVKLARDIDQLSEFVCDTKTELERAFAANRRVMLEGTQGTLLSIHHGMYPHVTSRETSTSGCLSDAGISPSRVRKVVMVTRTYPIRVGGNSGPMGTEITLEDIADRSAIDIEELQKTEKGTISGTKRRIAEFDWVQLRKSAVLNGATDIALTFADYHGIGNRAATTFQQLLPETTKFIDQVEMVSGARVSLISKEFAADGVIVRGEW